MTHPHGPERTAGRSISQILREQPHIKAPESLQEDVLAEIARLERRKGAGGFIQWPLLLRAVFVLGSSAAALASFQAVMWLRALLAPHFAWLGTTGRAVSMLAEAAGLVSQGISHWLYPCAMVLLMIYFVCAGLGATAYRTLRK